MQIEQRKDVRKKTFLKGRITFNGGASTMDCLIRDLSSSGARLELSETAALPEVFDLYVAQKDATFRATLRWRRDGGVGVTFEDPQRKLASETAGDASFQMLLRRVAELEAENATLRSLLATMHQAPPAGAA